MNDEYEFKQWVKGVMTGGKKEYTFSPDALEMVLRMAWNEGSKAATKTAANRAAADERERRYGPDI